MSSFLLTTNGWEYNVANIVSFVECILGYLFFPHSFLSWTEPIAGVKVQVVVGFLLIVMGQSLRTLAMVHAGRNFNHTVQVVRKEGHVLVKSGVYSVFRHPSYFGYFWWEIGMQLVMGNAVCLVTHTLVLWKFFNTRIRSEFSSFFFIIPIFIASFFWASGNPANILCC